MAMAGARGGDRPSTGAVVGLAAGLAGLSAAITLMFLAMRAVMAVGGSCAEGGPYVVATHCPDGAPAALFLGIFLLLVSWGLAGWFGPGVGGIWGSAGILGWSGLFVALGSNFLEAGFGGDRGLDATGLLLGAMFWAMGIVPLAWILIAALADRSRPGAAASLRQPAPNQLSAAQLHVESLDGVGAAAATPSDADPVESSDLVTQLEHLADLRSRAMLSDAEYAAAKAAVLAAADGER